MKEDIITLSVLAGHPKKSLTSRVLIYMQITNLNITNEYILIIYTEHAFVQRKKKQLKQNLLLEVCELEISVHIEKILFSVMF